MERELASQSFLAFSSEKGVFNSSSDSAYNYAENIELDDSYLVQIYIWKKLFKGLDQAHIYYCRVEEKKRRRKGDAEESKHLHVVEAGRDIQEGLCVQVMLHFGAGKARWQRWSLSQ